MSEIKRPSAGTETLTLSDCPCCGGDISVGDCGYSSFNVGWAKCDGDCTREWTFNYVKDKWDCGEKWNKRAAEIQRKLLAASLLRVDSKLMPTRNFKREELEQEAKELLKEIENQIIGAEG